jgi:CHAT domain-containing protein
VQVSDALHWREQLRHIEREMSELMRQGRKTTGGDGPLNGDEQEPAALLAAIQKRLNPDDVLLHYYTVQNHLHALLVTNSETYVIPNLVTTKVLERLLHTWRFYLYHVSAFAQATEAADQAARLYLGRLYQMLIAPLQPFLSGKNRIYLILPPEWHDIPMPALFDGKQYLIERCQLVYLSTAKAMTNAQPAFSFQAESAAADGRQSLIVGFSNDGRLPSAVEEARLIASVLPSAAPITSLVEEQATLDQIRNLAPTSHLLHLATHALFRPDNPLFSSIQLADGRMTVADLYEMTLTGRPFVILSACETGRGRPRGGGLLGMGRGFLAAGASGLIVTLWPVSDTTSAELMAGYYRTWLASSSCGDAAVALQHSQREAIAQGHSPLHWAGFIMIGG